jgi:putative acetyltransferase
MMRAFGAMSVAIRTAALDDRHAILDVVRAAFSADGRDGNEELDVVRETWARSAAADGLELVADDDGGVVGHVLGAHGALDGRDVVGIAPLAVTPSRQREGIGTELMSELLERADAAGLPLVVLLGSTEYYPRFGFEAAASLGITYQPVGAGDPHFQVRRLSSYDPSYTGDFRYCWELPRVP